MSKLVISKDNVSFKEICEIGDQYHDFISKSHAEKFKINLTLEEVEEGGKDD